MRVRELKADDIPVLRAMHERSGFAYEWPDLDSGRFESTLVVVDEEDRPIMAAFAERIVQLYLLTGDEGHPAAKLHGIRLLHQTMQSQLERKGYTEANAFLPPEVERIFGRRLMKTFGWAKNWLSYCIRF
jgi:hypothetical protein